MKKRRIITIMLLACTLVPHSGASAQEKKSTWYVGVGGGYRSSHASFSNIDKDYFPTNKNTGSGMFSLFVQGEFGKQGNFAIRPELAFTRRGGKLKDIGSDYYVPADIQALYPGEVYTEDVSYTLRAKYFDLRIPIIYNFCKAKSIARPYLFVAPVFGFTRGGTIRWQEDYTDDSFDGWELDISKANMSSAYVAGQVGVGVKFAIPVASDHCYLGVEASYEYGFTNTYGKKEKDSEANDVLRLFNNSYQLKGNRKLSGFEISAVLSVPFSIFKPKKKPEPEPVVYVPPVVEVVEEEPVVVEEKPCYTLDEIIDLMTNNQDIEGKTICAIDAINFDFAESTIKPESYDYLDKVAETLLRANKSVEVKGHTDNVGSDEFNMNLSKERAQAVMEYLVGKGVPRAKLRYSYYGKTRPLTTNSTEEGRATNRRVEFTILNNF